MSGLTGNNILAGSSGQGGYEIEQSLRFEDGDNAYLSRINGTPTNDKINTLSFWLKRGNITTSGAQWFFSGGLSGWRDLCGFNASSDHFQVASASTGYGQTTNMVFRDAGAWYHIVVVYDTTEALNDNRIKIYVNGSQVTTTKQGTVPLNQALGISVSGDTVNVGRYTSATPTSGYGDGYLAECHFIDGQALDASYFGETDPDTNKWIPKKYLGTYGNIGWYLTFSDSASLGADSSGNGNNFTPTNLAATDQVLDSPTNNFAVLADVNNPTDIYLEGRLKFQGLTSATSPYSTSVLGSFGVSSGKWYYEARANTVLNGVRIGFARDGEMSSDGSIPTYRVFDFDIWDNLVTTNNSYTNDFTVTGSAGDILGLAIDIDNGTASAYINGTLKGSVTGLNTSGYQNLPFSRLGYASGGPTLTMNFGQDSSFAGTETAQNNTDSNGRGDFYYAPPSGYLALCEDNLPDPSIALPGDHFNTVLGTGAGSTQSITGVGFQPDFLWVKIRNGTNNHALYDVIRGGTNALRSNTTAAESQYATDTVITFESDGFEIAGGATGGFNGSSDTFASWNWKADNTSGSTNTDGTITSTVSANTTAGFSIATYTGNGSTSPQTVGHGLSIAPNFVIVKRRDAVSDWIIGHDGLATNAFANNKFLKFDTSTVFTNAVVWGSQPTSSVVQITNGSAANLNASGGTYVMYCFHSVEGYSKFGSYTGGGGSDGTFIYTGFTPAFVIFKRTDAAQSWYMMDNKRNLYNVMNSYLRPNTTDAELTAVNSIADYVSNGIKMRGSGNDINGGSASYIYMAFAESPFKYSNAR